MEISLAAIMSIVALLIVVIISCVNEDLNVGFLAIAFAILVGGIWGDASGAKVLGYFPVGLFMILVGVTFLFGMAQTNGTMEKLTAYSIRICKGNTAIVPFVVFILTTFITTIGPGNIAGTALMAPVAMAIATRIGMVLAPDLVMNSLGKAAPSFPRPEGSALGVTKREFKPRYWRGWRGSAI